MMILDIGSWPKRCNDHSTHYDERDIAGTLEPAKEKLAGVLSEPAYSSVIHHVAVGHAHIDSAWL